jgi:hypothetical protein
MIDRTHALPVSQQTRLVGIARSSAYYRPQPVSESDELLMRRIDELHMEFPFAGARMLARLLRREGHEAGRRRVRTLMKRMGVEALYCKPNTSRRNAQHKVWSYLLRGMEIDRANQGVRTRHDVHSDGTRLRVPDGGSGLGEPQDIGSPGCHHAGGHARCRGAGRSVRPLWAAETSRSAMPGAPSANTSSCTTGNGPIRAWRIARRMRHTSRRCLRSNRQHDCLGRST